MNKPEVAAKLTSAIFAASLSITVSLFWGAAACRADVALPSVISDHMVVQAGMPVRLWGKADPGEKIHIAFLDQQIDTVANADGRWAAWLNPLKTGVRGNLYFSAKNRLTVTDVIAGEVWLAAGQSNMERAVKFSPDFEAVKSAAQDELYRLFIVEHAVSQTPADDVVGKWKIAAENTISGFSGTAYFFGRDLRNRRGVPVGIIQSAFGGTPIESWMSSESLDHPDVSFVEAEWQDAVDKYPSDLADYKIQLSKWRATLSEADIKALDSGKVIPGGPIEPRGPGSRAQPTGLFNGMIAPLVPYTIRGMIWYQGENNNKNEHEAYAYRSLFKYMISDWRSKWGEGDIPFIFAQLSRYKSNGLYPLIRESQSKALELSNTSMVVTIDRGMVGDVHYPDKQTIGDRFYREAARLVYKADNFFGPVAIGNVTSTASEVRISFKTDGAGIKLKESPIPEFSSDITNVNPNNIADGKSIIYRTPSADEVDSAFLIASDDSVFYPAKPILKANQLSLSSNLVKFPTQICYAWSDSTPAIMLWDRSGLPVSPFRASVHTGQEPNCPMSEH